MWSDSTIVPASQLPHFAPIELRQGRRKFKEEIDADEAAKVEDIAQPPITKAVATEAEKRRLQTYFEFKGLSSVLSFFRLCLC